MPINVMYYNIEEKIMNFHSTWIGTYSFVFELKDILKSVRDYIDAIIKKVESIDSKF